MLDIYETYNSLIIKGKENNFNVQELDIGNKHPTQLLALSKVSTKTKAPIIYLSSGIHGDEPAGPLALQQMLEENYFDDSVTWLICPLLNPYGLANNQRENPDNIDLNRDYRSKKTQEVKAHTQWLSTWIKKIDLSLGLHEDWEAKGFYLYDESMELSSTITQSILNSVSKICPIELASNIDGHAAKDGVIKPSLDEGIEFINNMEEWPEAIYLLAENLHPHYTFESPTNPPLHQRVKTNCEAIKKAIEGYLETQ